MTGFVVNDSSVWARSVSVAVAHDGALLVSEAAQRDRGVVWLRGHAPGINADLVA